MLNWHGVSSDEVGVIVEHYPNMPIPVRQQTFLNIPGRNGGILITQPTYDNVSLNYDVFITESDNIIVDDRIVMEWLLVPGYQELSDSYDEGITRYAYFNSDTEFVNTMNKAGRATLTFSAKPQRYLSEFLTPAAYTAPLVNPTANEAYPLIICHGTGTGTLTVGNTVVDLADCEIVLDCENQQAYYEGTNMNDKMSGDFPTLPAGTTSISFTGGITSVEVAPRWYYL